MKINIKAESDYLEKVSRATPRESIAEMIWNSLDGDAQNVNIQFLGNEINTESVEISDDGQGIPHDLAIATFGKLGGSWKKNVILTKTGRKLHGKEGFGRLKIFSLGNSVSWRIIYKENEEYFEYTISGNSSNLKEFFISDKKKTENKKTGVTVVVSDLIKDYKIFDEAEAEKKLAVVFAPYIALYHSVIISIGHKKITIENLVKNKISHELQIKNLPDEIKKTFFFDIYEWIFPDNHEFFLCDSTGFPLVEYDRQIRNIGNYSYSCYFKSDFFAELKQKNTLSLVDLDNETTAIINQAIQDLKGYFTERYRQDRSSIIERWKKDDVYPYMDNRDKTAIEDAEEKVFDIIALNINEQITDFDRSSKEQKKLQFKLLKHAIQSNPSNLTKIFQEVIDLPNEKAAELAELLNFTTLSSVISTSKMIADRQKFIAGFEEIVFDIELVKHTKERSQLHKLLADNTWFFGEEFSLVVDDQSLTQVLKQYILTFKNDVEIFDPVVRIDGRTGIIDLMFSKSVPKNHSMEAEFLVIELKAPKVKIGMEEINQIQSYAFAVADDERFTGINSKWEFWVISSELDSYAKSQSSQISLPKGVIHHSKNDNKEIKIWVKTWSEVIQENKHRHNFVQNTLRSSINQTDGVNFLREKYKQYFGNTE